MKMFQDYFVESLTHSLHESKFLDVVADIRNSLKNKW